MSSKTREIQLCFGRIVRFSFSRIHVGEGQLICSWVERFALSGVLEIVVFLVLLLETLIHKNNKTAIDYY